MALYPPDESVGVRGTGMTPIQLAPLQHGHGFEQVLQSGQMPPLRSGQMPSAPQQDMFSHWSMPSDPAAQALLQMSIKFVGGPGDDAS